MKTAKHLPFIYCVVNWKNRLGELSHEEKASRYTKDWLCWHRTGQYHRDGGPALLHKSGDSIWYYKGKLHRVGGPALMLVDGSNEYWENGRMVK